MLSAQKTGAQFGAIVKEVQSRTDAAPSAIRQALRELEEAKAVVAFVDKGSPGRPPYLYTVVAADAIEQKKPVTRDEMEVPKRPLLQELVRESSGRLSNLPPDELDRICREVAARFLDEDPAELFFRMGEWVFEQHRQRAVLVKQCKDKGDRDGENENRTILTGLEDLADRLFDRTLGVPKRLKNDDGEVIAPAKGEDGKLLRPAPYQLSFSDRTMEDTSSWDPKEFKRYLGMTIIGQTVLERVRPEKPKLPMHLGGSDASRQPIDLTTVLPWELESQELNIVTAVGVRYDVFTGARDIDRHPEPRTLAQYERRQAIEEGFLIPPPGTAGVTEDIYGRVLEAAMDLRQYYKDYDMVFLREPLVNIHFRDGRIFPLEHRLQDAIQLGLHGLIVRSALRIFRQIVNGVGAEEGQILYCGYVKRTHIPIMKDLFYWYAGFGSTTGKSTPVLQGITPEDFVKAPESDSLIMSYLFNALKQLDEEATYVTFRILRRFQSMEEDPVRNFEPSTSKELWSKRLGKMAQDWLGSDPESEGIDLIASLCARAAVIEFYVSPTKQLDPHFESHLAVPRIEVLAPYHDIDGQRWEIETVTKKEAAYVNRLLGGMFYEGVQDYYHEDLNQMGRSPTVFLAPRPVVEAHEGCKEIARIYKMDFVELLIREAKIYWEQLGAKGPGPRP